MIRHPIAFAASTVLATALATAPAPAAEIDNAAQYRACMTLAAQDPEQALKKAMAWRVLGGGDAARHCGAKALTGLGQYDEAARHFEALAQDIKAEPAFKARILGHAAQAWLMDGNPERAQGVLAAALRLVSDDGDFLVDRAVVLGTLGKYRDAIDDLDRAIASAPTRAEADVRRALALDVNHPDGLLERSIIRRLRGDDAGARRDWLRLLDLAADGPIADAARANIEKMDVKAR